MATLDSYRDLIERILTEYAEIPYRLYPELHTYPIFDRVHDRYLLMNIGWEMRDGSKYRVYYPLMQVDIIDGKFWVQYDGTDAPVAKELELAGIPRDQIVLGFREPELRPYTEYAVE